ncbi:MAG: multidrug effflux MFS transporter [Rhodobacteraceae bacterium]|nr:multidrug effflux MFS transporter [Paracoccaceae bacterium]
MASTDVPVSKPVTAQTRFLDRTTPPHVLTLVLLAGLAALAMNMFLPSLPSMAAYFDTDYRVMQLSVSLYLAVNALLQVFIGPISDRFGRRPVLLWSLAGFIIATLGTLLATSAGVFLFFRMLQAVVVSTIVLSRAAIRDVMDEAAAASRIGYVTMGMALVPMIAPAIGGLLDEVFGWRGSFALMLLAGIGILALTWADLGETKAPGNGGLRSTFADLPELMTSRRFWGYCITAMLASGSFFAYLGGAPFVGSEVFGLSPAVLGIYFGAPAVGYAFGNFLSGRYAVRIGVDRMVLWGCLVCLAGVGMMSVFFAAGAQVPAVFFGFFIFVGLGNGMVLPSATSGMMSVRPHLAGTASGIGGAILIGGGAALSALAGALLTPETGAAPLLGLLLTTSSLSVVSIIYVIRRRRVIGA